MGIGVDPDLVITALSAPPALQPGQPFDVLATVCNQGTITAPPSWLHVYFSTDDTA